MNKVLVFSHNCFSQTSNNGKTLSNIFFKFSSEELCQLYLSENEVPDFSVCKNYFQITDKEILRSFFSLKSNVGKVVTKEIFRHQKQGNLQKKIKPTRINDLRTIIRNLLWKSARWNSDKLQEWIRDQNPSCIFFVGGNYTFSHQIARIISSESNIPLITYFTDDYIINPIYKRIIEKIYKYYLIRSFKKTVLESKLVFCIGEMMAQAYTEYFNRKFEPIMNCVESSKIKNYNQVYSSNIIRISYFGGLHLKRSKSIISFSKCLKKINDIDETLKIEVYVYTFSEVEKKMKDEFSKNNVQLQKPVKGLDYEQAISESNLLLHVESDDPIVKSYTKLSVSTKLPEYFISYRPVIGFGPSDVASMKLISDNDLGIVVDSKLNTKGDIEKLSELLHSANQREYFANKAYKYAYSKFLKEKVSIHLYNKLNQPINHDFI